MEGHAREFVSKIQNMRKSNDYEVSDRITIYYQGDEFKEVVEKFGEYIQNETLATSIEESNKSTEEINVNGIKVLVSIAKVK